jgi:hypothetical protein
MIALTDTGLALLAIHDPSPQLRYARRVRAVKLRVSIEVVAPLETVGFIPRIPATKCDGSGQ